jgi:type IV secretion system protein VirB11
LSFETPEQLERLGAKLKRELGPDIVKALEDPDVIEICVNSDGHVWIEEIGKADKTDKANEGIYDSGNTITPDSLLAALGTIAAMNGTEINESNTILEGRLPLDGSRVAGTVPPTSPDGPSMTIRKHASAVFPLSQYAEEKRITPFAAEYLRGAIRGAKNILVAGGTGSGKTTFVNALIRELLEIAPRDRLIVVEDTAELQCATKNKQSFVTSKDVSMQELVKTAMRYRPSRIIIGEVRGKEALDLLKSWNTGHPGGLATVHANSASAALLRLEHLISEASVSPMSALIAEAVNVVVFMAQHGQTGKMVTEIIRVNGYREGEYRYETVYRVNGADRGNSGNGSRRRHRKRAKNTPGRKKEEVGSNV